MLLLTALARTDAKKASSTYTNSIFSKCSLVLIMVVLMSLFSALEMSRTSVFFFMVKLANNLIRFSPEA